MKEVTRIITVRITEIADISNRETLSKDECERLIKAGIKHIFNVDDVVIDSIQDFIMEKEEPKWEERTGERWIGSEVCERFTYYSCNKCGRRHDRQDPYCPNCGAKMKGR